jgi:hypothetical protein
MKIIKLFSLLMVVMSLSGCVPFDQIYSHSFDSGYYRLKTTEAAPEKVYLNLSEDTLTVYRADKNNKSSLTGTIPVCESKVSSIHPGNLLYNSTFVRTSADIDLSTVLLKYRPASANVQPQLNANVNGVLYAGFRKDYFRIKTHFSPLSRESVFIRHAGIDFGLFAGLGITPVNPTVTDDKTLQEYDGIVFQKGVSLFITLEDMSVGFALGFDNLLDQNSKIWIYNQKPWIGIILGVANF